MKESIKIKGKIDFKITRVNGKVEKWTVHNSIMNAGFAQLALLAGDASAVPFTYLAVGTSTTAVAASQTALAAEATTLGMGRAAATVSLVTTTQTNDTLQLVYQWTATGTITIEEIGIFNDASVGTMLARALTATKTLGNGDKLDTTYKIKFS